MELNLPFLLCFTLYLKTIFIIIFGILRYFAPQQVKFIIFIKCNHKFAIKGCESNIYTIQDGTTTSKPWSSYLTTLYERWWMEYWELLVARHPRVLMRKKRHMTKKVPFVSFCPDNPRFVLSALKMSRSSCFRSWLSLKFTFLFG